MLAGEGAQAGASDRTRALNAWWRQWGIGSVGVSSELHAWGDVCEGPLHASTGAVGAVRHRRACHCSRRVKYYLRKRQSILCHGRVGLHVVSRFVC